MALLGLGPTYCITLQTIFGADNVTVTLGGGGCDVKIINLCQMLLAVGRG